MKTKPKLYRQGDVIIQRIISIPATAKPVNKQGHNRIILALGEATGHHHSLDIDSADWWKSADGQEQFISVPETASVTHQEHSSIALPLGKYRVVIQREYHPKEIRRVQD
jgi:hypothetical protein